VTAAVTSTVETLKAEAAKADKATVEKVITECKTLIAEKEKVVADLQTQIKEKTAAMAQNVLGGQGSSTDALKAEVEKLKGQLDAATKDLSGLNEKLSVYVAELAKRPA